MRRVLLSGALAMLMTASFAQRMSAEAFEEYLEEKVRNPEVIEYIQDLAEQSNWGESPELVTLPPIEEFMSRFKSDSQERVEYTFAGGAEPFIAINPTNSLHLVVSYMAAGNGFEYPVYYSMDGGDTWTMSSFNSTTQLDNTFPGDAILGGGDPVLAFDDDGTLHLTYIYLHGSGINIKAGMFYVNSTDGGATFNIPAFDDHIMHDESLFSQDMIDRQWMIVDNTGGPYDGNLYMSAIYFGGSLGNAGEIVLVKPADSTGFIMSPTVAVPISGGESAQFGNIKVDNNGDVHMGCMKFDSQSAAGDFLHTVSTDGGITFSTPTVVGSGVTALPNGGNHPVHGRDNSASSLAVEGSNVYMAWSDFDNNDLKSFYVYSNDGGTTFSSPIEYGRNIYGNGYYHLMPNLAAADGNMSVCWYKVDSVTFETEYNVAVSTNAGNGITGYQTLSGGTTDFANENSQDFYGDYNCSVMAGCIVHTAWSDGRSGSPVVYHGKVNACILGVDEKSPLTDLISAGDLYPNPVSEYAQLQITLKEPMDLKYEIIDNSGKLVKSSQEIGYNQGTNQLNIDVAGIAEGIYTVRVSASNGLFLTRALVKVK